MLFVEDGRVRFDVGWVGATGANTPVADGKWHRVAVTVSAAGAGDNVKCYVDGRLSGEARLDVSRHDETGLPVRIGFCNDDFPTIRSAFVGDIDNVQWFAYTLSPDAVNKL